MYVILGVHHYQYILKKTLLYFFLLFSMFSIRLLIFYNSSRVDKQFAFSTTLCTCLSVYLPLNSQSASHFMGNQSFRYKIVSIRA